MRTATALGLMFGAILLSWALAAMAAEPRSSAAGHWEGGIQLPTTRLEVRVDLDLSTGGAWSGTIDIPVQALRGFKLADVAVTGRSVFFAMPGVPGDPKFSGQLDEAATGISGQLSIPVVEGAQPMR